MPIDPLLGGLALGALSIGGGIASNSAIAANASSNAKATAKMLAQNFGVQTTQLQEAGVDIRKQAGIELTNLVFQSLAAQGTTSAMSAERGLTGNTARRQIQNVSMKEALTADQILQQADSKLVDIQNKLRNAKYEYESGQMQNVMNYNSQMSQVQSPFSLLASGISTGLSTYGALKPL